MRNRFFNGISGLFRALYDTGRYYWTPTGRELWTLSGSPDEVERDDGLERFFSIGLSPLAFAGKRFRDVSRLWVSAAGLEKNEEGAYHPPQVIMPEGGKAEHLEFVQWVFDEAFQTKGMRQILTQILNALISYGRCVEDVVWFRGETPMGERIFPVDIRDCNPQFFLKDPPNKRAGIWQKDSLRDLYGIKRMPDKRFMWGTNHMYFDNPYGISELRILDEIEKYWRENLKFWAKGNEKSGTGSYILSYARRLAGKGTEREEARKNLLSALKDLKSDSVMIKPDDTQLEVLNNAIQSDSFKDHNEALGQIYSIVLTGSVTALQEGRVGGFSKEKETTTKRKGELEGLDCSLLEEIFNFQLIPWMIDLNYPDAKIYPRLQIIEPERIHPLMVKEEEEEEKPEPGKKKEEKEEKKESKEFVEVFTDGVGIKKNPTPPIFDLVKNRTRGYITTMPVYTRQNFDKRTDAEKRNAWTVTALGNHPNSIGRIQKLRDLVADTIAIPNESEAWDRYWIEARKYLRHDQKTSALESELFISFRFARQRAYNRAIDDLIHDDQDILWGIRLETQDDPRVRPGHVKLHGVTLPPEHKFWQDLNLPLDWNCRCYKIPLMKATAQSGGYTPEKDIPTIPKGFE